MIDNMKASIPYLSLTMPVYNVKEYLKRGIDSVLQQTFTDFELIIIDDGSTDGSGDICDYYAQLDERVIVIHQENQGLVMARDVALKKVRGRCVGFVDPDDWIEKEFFEKIIESMKKTDASIGIGGYVIEFENGKVERKFNNNKELVLSRDDALENLFTFKYYQWELWDKIYKREVIENIDVDKQITCGEDLCRVYPAFCNADKVCVVPLYGYHYMQRSNSMTKWKKKSFINTVYYAMTTIDKDVKMESKKIYDAYLMRKNRFLLINTIEAHCQGYVDNNFYYAISKQWYSIIWGDYPIKFKLAALLIGLMSKLKGGKLSNEENSSRTF